jgi:hypothetical protein
MFGYDSEMLCEDRMQQPRVALLRDVVRVPQRFYVSLRQSSREEVPIPCGSDSLPSLPGLPGQFAGLD